MQESPLNFHQFCLTRDSKYGLVGTDQNATCQYFVSIQLYLALLFIKSIPNKLNARQQQDMITNICNMYMLLSLQLVQPTEKPEFDLVRSVYF